MLLASSRQAYACPSEFVTCDVLAVQTMCKFATPSILINSIEQNSLHEEKQKVHMGEGPYNLHSSINNIRMMKSMRIRWAGQ
jgi:hypothetical protein